MARFLSRGRFTPLERQAIIETLPPNRRLLSVGAGLESLRAMAQLETAIAATPSRGADFIRCEVRRSTLGWTLIAASEIGVCAILLGDEPGALLEDFQARFPKATAIGGDADYERLSAAVLALIERPDTSADFPLDARGTAFQRRVWRALRAIPPGATASYAEIARRIGSPKAMRAVAGACAANPVAIAIPCHRVVRSDGALSGYRWGVERKRMLLAREGAA